MNIGERLQYLRAQRGWSLSELGEKAGGISKGYLSTIENGDVNPSSDIVRRIAEAFDVPMTALLEDRADLTPDENALLMAYRAGDLQTMMRLALERVQS